MAWLTCMHCFLLYFGLKFFTQYGFITRTGFFYQVKPCTIGKSTMCLMVEMFLRVLMRERKHLASSCLVLALWVDCVFVDLETVVNSSLLSVWMPDKWYRKVLIWDRTKELYPACQPARKVAVALRHFYCIKKWMQFERVRLIWFSFLHLAIYAGSFYK